MASPPVSAHAAEPAHPVDDDGFSSAATAAENTPLLRSQAFSTGTMRDGLADGEPSGVSPEDLSEAPVLGWKRAVCIILSMWALIFLQGEAPCLYGLCTGRVITASKPPTRPA